MAYSPFALCVVIVVAALLVAIAVASTYERARYGYVSRCSVWQPWHPRVHFGWLLALRIIAFLYCSSVLIYDFVLFGPFIFEFYTQWSFTILILYFAVAIVTSIKEILHHRNIEEKNVLSNGLLTDHHRIDEEFATSVNGSHTITETYFNSLDEACGDGYATHILYQTALGAALVTDIIYWSCIFPVYSFIDMIEMSMHAVNLILLLSDVALNNMVFYLFRGAYFFIYTSFFIFFAWTVHALGEKEWPYSFLDVSVNLAPLWYFLLGIVTFIAYSLVWGIMHLKQMCVTRYTSPILLIN